MIIDTLHSSRGGNVYLAEHLNMHVKRVIKEVVKDSNYEESFYAEMDALKQIRHMNIPVVYDVELDIHNYYIIEEYIEGTSLYDLVIQQGKLSEEQTVSYGKQLTNLITFLHSRKPYPILFLDLQPKNIIISGDNLFLIDFGSSMLQGNGQKGNIFGTPGFAAPEQYCGVDIGIETDIYGIGALLYFMVTGTSLTKGMEISKSNCNFSQSFRQIILRCIENSTNLRYESAQKLYEQLNYLQDYKCKAYKEDKPLVISVAGIDRRVGTTHMCLLMNQFLSGYKITHIYQENNESNHIRNFAKLQSEISFSNGLFIFKKHRLMPKYGENVELMLDDRIIIRDEGIYNSEKMYGDLLYIVCDGSQWEIENTKEKLQKASKYDGIIWNFTNGLRKSIIYKMIQERNFFIEYEPDINDISNEATQVFYALLEEVIEKFDVKAKKEKATKKSIKNFFKSR